MIPPRMAVNVLKAVIIEGLRSSNGGTDTASSADSCISRDIAISRFRIDKNTALPSGARLEQYLALRRSLDFASRTLCLPIGYH